MAAERSRTNVELSEEIQKTHEDLRELILDLHKQASQKSLDTSYRTNQLTTRVAVLESDIALVKKKIESVERLKKWILSAVSVGAMGSGTLVWNGNGHKDKLEKAAAIIHEYERLDREKEPRHFKDREERRHHERETR